VTTIFDPPNPTRIT